MVRIIYKSIQKIKVLTEEYNRKIIYRGKKRYIVRLLITTILQTLAISVLPSIIDSRYENLRKKFIVIFLFFLVWNFFIVYRFARPNFKED